MNILLVTHAVFLDPTRISTGNSVRGYYLSKGLAAAGHNVVFAYPRELERFSSRIVERPEPGVRTAGFSDRNDFLRLLQQCEPDCILVGYWEMLELLPENIEVPVIVDVVAPRVLEAMFQSERTLDDDIRRMLTIYRRADRFLAGTERQRHFLLPWLIMAGFDCRYAVPVDVVPISTEVSDAAVEKRADAVLRFVSGGVSWPWRRTGVWFDALVDALHEAPSGSAKFALFAGEYIYGGQGDGTAGETAKPDRHAVVESHGLLSYGDMQAYLAAECDIGVELADRNVEREYSQSFRAMEFLRAGLPLICNDYLEIADSVREYDAGWVIGDLSQVPQLIADILADRDSVARKSRNAKRLVNERFHYLQTVEPILAFLASPGRPARRATSLLQPSYQGGIAPASFAADMKAKLVRGFATLKRRAATAARRLTARLRGDTTGGDIVIVTRSDVFPTDHGAAVKIDRTAAGLSQLGRTVYLLTDDRRRYFIYRHGERSEAVFPGWLSALGLPRPLVRRRVIAKGVPAGDAFLYYPLCDWSYILRTLYLALKHPISVFQAEFPAYARACVWGRRLFGGKVIVVEHNVEYQRLRDQEAGLSPAGFEFLKAAEIRLCNLADVVIAVSERDRSQLIQDGVNAGRVHYVPHGVDLTAFDAAAPAEVRTQYGIDDDTALLVYHGTYQYPPNLEAMAAMAENVLPALQARGVKVKVLALGNHPPSRPLHDDIIFTGSVPQVAPYLRAADIAVVPLLKGGGTRMKILDYFAAALPVVSTDKGIEGIPAEDGVHARIVDSAGEVFARAVAELLADREKARRIGISGREYVERLDWKVIAQRYIELLETS